MTEFEAKKVYLKDAQGDYVVPVAYSAKYDMNGDVIDVSELEADLVYNKYSTKAQSGIAIASALEDIEGGDVIMTELASSGTVNLSDNSAYRVTPSGSLSFVLPEGDSESGVPVDEWSEPVQVGTNSWNGIAYGNNVYVLAGSDLLGNGYITTSTDGITWETPTQFGNAWYSLAYGNGKFVIAGYQGYVSTSEDGTTWSTPTKVSTNTWSNMTYGNSMFVMVNGNGYITTSTDGTTWSTPVQVGSSGWHDVTYGDDKFVVVGNSGYITTSEDGTTWTTPVQIASSSLYCVRYCNDMFIAVGINGYITTSTDGTTWTTPAQVGSGGWQGVTYSDSKFVVVGSSGYITTSTDGTTWTTPVQVGTSSWYDVVFLNRKLIAVGDNGYTMYNPTRYLLDPSKFHQILVQVNMSTVQTIDVGTSAFFGDEAPDISSDGVYNLVFEYDNNNYSWVCGLLSK